jgi:type II secretory pathway pseudopilin PulG
MPKLGYHLSVPRRARPRDAFSLVEAIVALTIMAVAGAALVVGMDSSLQTTNASLEETIALGMAQQLMDEVLGARYMEYGGSPHLTYLGPSAWEAAPGTRERFDDIDDYNDFASQPPTDAFGIALGADDGQGGQRPENFWASPGFFDRWQRQVEVYYVDGSDPGTRLPDGQTSDYRAVEVRILVDDPHRGPRTLVQLRRVVAYVPPL